MSRSPSSSILTVSQYNGSLVAVRSATDPQGCARLGHEAAILARVPHPGVVSLVDHSEGPPAILRTLFVGPDSWRDRPPTGAAVAPALASLGETLADLHAAGVTHGRLDPSHVLVGPDDRPVLCGFAEARSHDAARAGDDIGAFVRLGRTLLTDDDQALDPILNGLAAGHDDLRAAADALGRRRLPPAGRAPRRATQARPRRLTAAAGVFAIAGVLAIAGRPTVPEGTAERIGRLATGSNAMDESDPAEATTVGPSNSSADGGGGPGPGATGPQLVHDARRYVVGRPGDLVATGDWNCDGTPTPAVLRPETGEVAVFDRWPPPGASIAPSFRTVVDRPIDLVPGSGDCPDLRVSTATGSRLILIPEP